MRAAEAGENFFTEYDAWFALTKIANDSPVQDMTITERHIIDGLFKLWNHEKRRNGFEASINDIACASSVSESSVRKYRVTLQEKGYISFTAGEQSTKGSGTAEKSTYTMVSFAEIHDIYNAEHPKVDTSAAHEEEAADDPAEAEEKKTPSRREKQKQAPEQDESFEKFWQAYPRKQSKKNALKTWRKLHPGDEVQQAILNDISYRLQSCEWSTDKDRYSFIPLPATYLNAERWQDERKPAQPQKQTAQQPTHYLN